MLDPIDCDLQVLERFNRFFEALVVTVSPAALARIQHVVESDRGLGYRPLHTLVFRPSRDIGALALEHLRQRGAGWRGGVASMLLARAAALGARVEADFLSYVLFDGAFARTLIELGRADVKTRGADVEALFHRRKRRGKAERRCN